MLNVFASGLCGLAAAGWVAEETGWDKGLLAWTMVLTLPLVSATVWTTQNDVLLAFFLTLFFYALVRWAQGKGETSWALAAGLFGGAALAIKYTAVAGIAAGLLALAFGFRNLFKANRKTGWGLLFSLIALSIAPWLIRNFSFTGNPIYPYFSSLLGGRVFPAENMQALMGDHEVVFNGNFSLSGWVLQVLGRDLDKTIAPLLFGFIPFLFLSGKRSPRTRYLLIAGGLFLIFGFLISHQLRLMIPAFVVCLMAIAMVLEDFENKAATYVWGGVAALFGILSILSLCRLSTDYYQSQKIWFGTETREEYLTDAPQTSSYYDLTQACADLPSQSRLLIVGDARGLYYPRPFYANSVFDVQVFPELAQKENDGEGVGKRLREMGIDAIVFSSEEAKRLDKYPFHSLSPDDEKKLHDFFQNCHLLYGRGSDLILQAPGSMVK
jgi:MFS family permease